MEASMFEKIAYAADGVPAGGAQASPLPQFFLLILMFAIFYFLLIRPQQKKQKELQQVIANLKKGDRVITNGGIIGTISSIQEDYLVLNVGDSATKLEVLKSAVAGMRQ